MEYYSIFQPSLLQHEEDISVHRYTIQCFMLLHTNLLAFASFVLLSINTFWFKIGWSLEVLLS